MSSARDIFKDLNPTKISYARRLKMGATGWGAITQFYVDSVKINCNMGKLRSAALIKVIDKAGQVTILIEGSHMGVLFNLTPEQWGQIEQLSKSVRGEELFYRYFRNGLTQNFPHEQQIFYHFCLTCQTSEPFFISFHRVPNTRKGDKLNAFLKVIEAKPHTPALLRNYFDKCERMDEESKES